MSEDASAQMWATLVDVSPVQTTYSERTQSSARTVFSESGGLIFCMLPQTQDKPPLPRPQRSGERLAARLTLNPETLATRGVSLVPQGPQPRFSASDINYVYGVLSPTATNSCQECSSRKKPLTPSLPRARTSISFCCYHCAGSTPTCSGAR